MIFGIRAKSDFSGKGDVFKAGASMSVQRSDLPCTPERFRLSTGSETNSLDLD